VGSKPQQQSKVEKGTFAQWWAEYCLKMTKVSKERQTKDQEPNNDANNTNCATDCLHPIAYKARLVQIVDFERQWAGKFETAFALLRGDLTHGTPKEERMRRTLSLV
jgi:hypothetical protein